MTDKSTEWNVMGLDIADNGENTIIAAVHDNDLFWLSVDKRNSWSQTHDLIIEAHRTIQPVTIWATVSAKTYCDLESLMQAGLPIRVHHSTANSYHTLITDLVYAIETDKIDVSRYPLVKECLEHYYEVPGNQGRTQWRKDISIKNDAFIAVALAWYGSHRGRILLDFS